MKEFVVIVHLHLSQTQITLVFLIECCLDSAIQYFVYGNLIADNHGVVGLNFFFFFGHAMELLVEPGPWQ